jgi:hypothetical protein
MYNSPKIWQYFCQLIAKTIRHSLPSNTTTNISIHSLTYRCASLVQWLGLALSKWPNRIGFSRTWGRKQIQFPKRRVSLGLFFNTRTMDTVRKLNISESYSPSSESYSNHWGYWLYNFCYMFRFIEPSTGNTLNILHYWIGHIYGSIFIYIFVVCTGCVLFAMC